MLKSASSWLAFWITLVLVLGAGFLVFLTYFIVTPHGWQ